MSVEQDLVTRAVQGDADAFEQLYERNFDRVYRYLYVRLGNQAEAEDLTQEVFAKVLEAIGSFQWRNVPFASWLFRIAHNKMIDHIRRERRIERVDSDETVLSLDGPDPVEIAENIKKSGGSIPGMRPGRETADYIDRVLGRLTGVGAAYVALVCVLPVLLTSQMNIPFYFGGTALLIVVGVALDTVSQVDAHMVSRHYEGFVKGGRIRGRLGR